MKASPICIDLYNLLPFGLTQELGRLQLTNRYDSHRTNLIVQNKQFGNDATMKLN